MSGLRFVQVENNPDGMAHIDIESHVVQIEEIGKETPGIGALMRLYAPMELSSMALYELFRATLLRLDKPQSVARSTLRAVMMSRRTHKKGIPGGLNAQWFSLEPKTNSVRGLTVDEMRKAVGAWSQHKGPHVTNLGALFIETYGSWQDTDKAIRQITDDIKSIAKLLPTAGATVTATNERSAEPRPAAVAWREHLLALNWPTSADVGDRLGSGSVSNAGQYASQLRKRGKLLGVWSAKDGTYRHPDFQFDASGQLRPRLAELLSLIDDKDDAGGWRRAFWLYGTSDALDDKSPADMFIEDPERVIALAKQERAEDEAPNGNY